MQPAPSSRRSYFAVIENWKMKEPISKSEVTLKSANKLVSSTPISTKIVLNQQRILPENEFLSPIYQQSTGKTGKILSAQSEKLKGSIKSSGKKSTASVYDNSSWDTVEQETKKSTEPKKKAELKRAKNYLEEDDDSSSDELFRKIAPSNLSLKSKQNSEAHLSSDSSSKESDEALFPVSLKKQARSDHSVQDDIENIYLRRSPAKSKNRETANSKKAPSSPRKSSEGEFHSFLDLAKAKLGRPHKTAKKTVSALPVQRSSKKAAEPASRPLQKTVDALIALESKQNLTLTSNDESDYDQRPEVPAKATQNNKNAATEKSKDNKTAKKDNTFKVKIPVQPKMRTTQAIVAQKAAHLKKRLHDQMKSPENKKKLRKDENESSQEVSGNTLNNSSKGASKRRKMFQQSDPSNTILEEVVVEELVNPSKKRTKIRPSRIPRKTTSKLEQDVRALRKSSRARTGPIKFWEQRLNYVYVDGDANLDTAQPVKEEYLKVEPKETHKKKDVSKKKSIQPVRELKTQSPSKLKKVEAQKKIEPEENDITVAVQGALPKLQSLSGKYFCKKDSVKCESVLRIKPGKERLTLTTSPTYMCFLNGNGKFVLGELEEDIEDPEFKFGKGAVVKIVNTSEEVECLVYCVEV